MLKRLFIVSLLLLLPMSVYSAVDYEPSLYVHPIEYDSVSVQEGFTDEVSVSVHTTPTNQTSHITEHILSGVNKVLFAPTGEYSQDNYTTIASRQNFEVGWRIS